VPGPAAALDSTDNPVPIAGDCATSAGGIEGKLVRNVAKLVSPPEHTKRERETWSPAGTALSALAVPVPIAQAGPSR